jgi:hypothetical protein
MSTPTTTMAKLTLCCVALAVFSLALRSPHLTEPSSLVTVTCLRTVLADRIVVLARAVLEAIDEA